MSDDTTTTVVADTTTTDSTAADTNSTTATAPDKGQGQGEVDTTADTTTTDDADKGDADKDKKAEGAPEKYEPFTLPDGTVLEGDRLDQAHAFFRENGWPQDKAQDIVSTYIRFRGDELAAERGLWAEQSETEFGKDFVSIAKGAERSLIEAESIRPGITERLDATNLGNHPDVLWVFNRLGQLTKETGMAGLGGETANGKAEPLTPQAILYPNDVKK